MLRKISLTFTFLIAALAAAMLLLAQAPSQGGGKGKDGPKAKDGAKDGGKGKDGKGGAPAAPPQAIMQLKPDLYLITGAGGNTSVRITKEGLIVGDTKNLGDAFYNEMMALIKTVSAQPVKWVVVTHHHQDHSGNIKKFTDSGAMVVAHANLKKNLVTYAPAQGKPGDPNVTYDKKYSFKLGGVKAEVYHYGRAHTSGDSCLYYGDLKVVQCGDVVVGVAPNIDYPFGGSGLEWLKVLNGIAKLNFDTLIPGHSAPNQNTMTKADFMAYKMKWETFISRAEAEVKKGTAKDKLMASIKTDDIGWNLAAPNGVWQQPARLDPFFDEMSTGKVAPMKP
jgi:cyclase